LGLGAGRIDEAEEESKEIRSQLHDSQLSRSRTDAGPQAKKARKSAHNSLEQPQVALDGGCDGTADDVEKVVTK
jgi:ElaB/YqjD/DUF883 family membrane-anchored ribosome-binding protein